MKFIKTNQPILLCDTAGNFIQRIGHAFQVVQLAVYAAHEFMEMQSGLAHDRYDQIKTIHEKRFPPADTTPQVNAAWNFRAADQALESGRTFRLESDPVVVCTLQPINSKLLCIVVSETPL